MLKILRYLPAICMLVPAWNVVTSHGAEAALISLDFGGTVTSSSISGTGGSFSGQIYFDPSAIDTNISPNQGDFLQGASTQIQVSSGVFSITNSLSEILTQYQDPSFTNDTLAFRSLTPFIVLELDSINGASLTSDAIPTTIPLLSTFSLFHHLVISLDTGQSLQGNVTTLSQTEVPEPASMGLLFTALGVMAAIRSRRRYT